MKDNIRFSQQYIENCENYFNKTIGSEEYVSVVLQEKCTQDISKAILWAALTETCFGRLQKSVYPQNTRLLMWHWLDVPHSQMCHIWNCPSPWTRPPHSGNEITNESNALSVISSPRPMLSFARPIMLSHRKRIIVKSIPVWNSTI